MARLVLFFVAFFTLKANAQWIPLECASSSGSISHFVQFNQATQQVKIHGGEPQPALIDQEQITYVMNPKDDHAWDIRIDRLSGYLIAVQRATNKSTSPRRCIVGGPKF